MKKFNLILTMLLVTVAIMFTTSQIGYAEATSTQDVIDAWNNNCDDYDFAGISSLNLGVTCGNLYQGQGLNFVSDISELYQAMGTELQSFYPDAAKMGDYVDFVIADPAWWIYCPPD